MNGRSETISVISVFVLLLMMGSVHAASVDLDGWTFTAELGDQWRLGPQVIETADSRGLSSTDYENWNFKGNMVINAFWLPKDSDYVAPTNIPSVWDEDSEDVLAGVDIKVNTVPSDERGWEAKEILADFLLPFALGDESQKDIEFNGHPALLMESNEDSISSGLISILVSEDTIVTIEVGTKPESDLSAWDVIEKFTISKK
jgi:hypothetical protein